MNGFKSIKAQSARSAVWAVFASVLASLAVPARAANYDISGGIAFQVPDTVVLDSYSLAGPINISLQVLYDNVVPGRSWHGRAGSGADGYGLHASTYVGANNIASGDSGGLIFRAVANVLVTFTDFVISGPVGSGPIQTPINFHLSGEQILGSYSSSSPVYISNVSSSVNLSVFAGNNGADGGNSFYYRNGVSSPPTQTGMLVGFGGDANVQTPLWTLPVNTPFSMTLILGTTVQVGVVFSDGYITSALSDFGNTLSFATDRPVFGLPAGYSVYSAEAGIVDNTFSSPVPEPASGLLAALGLLAVGGWTRRRHGAAAAALSLLPLWPLLAAAPARAEVRFTVTNLGTLGGTSSEAFAIHASGCATAYTPSRRSVS